MIERRGHRLVRLGEQACAAGGGADRWGWEEDAAACRTVFERQPPHWLIVDHYGLDERWESTLRRFVRRTLVIDDLADRRHACDILVDMTLGRQSILYAPLVASECRVLTGTDYALLRSSFVAARSAARARRGRGPVRRVLIALGLGDSRAALDRAIRAVLPQTSVTQIDIVLAAEDASALAQDSAPGKLDPRLRIHSGLDAAQMAHLMVAADVAVGAAGSSSWERCCLGLPSIIVILAENQRAIAAALQRAGAAIVVDLADSRALESALAELLGDGPMRARMADAAAAVVDGSGGSRVAAAMAAMP